MNGAMNPLPFWNQMFIEIQALNAPGSVVRDHPQVLGDTFYSGITVFRNVSAPTGAHHSQVGRNRRPPDWKCTWLPPFEKNFYREHFSTTQRPLAEVEAYREANDISVRGRGVPKPLLNIEEAGFDEGLMEAIQNMKCESFGRLHAQCWPVALGGRDLFAIVKGEADRKILGYLLPAIAHVRHQEPCQPGSGPIVVVLTESRQCARKVEQVVHELEKYIGVRVMCLCSGAPKEQQLKQLEEGAEICVATPGRLMDFIEKCKVSLCRCTYLVLDGADRMVAVGFDKALRCIADNIRPDRQTHLWVASRTVYMERLAQELLTDPVTVTIGASQAYKNHPVEQLILVCEKDKREEALIALFRDMPWNEGDKAIVYVQMKQTVHELVLRLKSEGFSAVGTHGRMTEEEQKWALTALRFPKVAVLVATDSVGRHIVADGVRFVVNYDFPRYADDYADRMKLTARANESGAAYTFLAPTDSRRAKELVSILREAKQVPSPKLLRLAKTTGFHPS